jgi:O-antigen/teichoic acid export membrane protein
MGRKVIIQFLATGFSGLLAFIAISLSARLFGPETIGQVTYLSGLLGLVFAFSDLGLSRAHVHFTAGNKNQPLLFSFLSVKFLLLLVCVLAAGWLAKINQQLSWLFLILLSFEVLSRLADSLLITFEGQERVWPQNLVRLIGKTVKLAAVAILAVFWRNSYGYSLTFLAESLVVLGAALVISRHFWQFKIDKAAVKKYWQYALPFALVMPLSYFQDNGLIVIIRQFWSAGTLGVYAASFGLFGLLKSFSSSLMVFFFPRISSLDLARDKEKIQGYADLAVKLSIWLLAPLCLLLFIFAEPVVTLVLGRQFIDGASIFRWLLGGILILAVFTPYDHVLFAMNKHHSIVWVNLIDTILVLGLGWLLIPPLGGQGAAIALVVGWLSGGLWQFMILRQKTGIHFCRDFRLSRIEIKYLYGLIHSFSQAIFRRPGIKAS